MHEGHRQRMYAKLENGELYYDHEILEVLLYSVCPRINTNPVAHSLLNKFCSLSGVFKADVEELKSVDGVGNKIADFIRTVGVCINRINNVECAAVLKNFNDLKNFVSMRFTGKKDEIAELYFLDKKGLVKRILTYTSSDRNKVIIDTKEVSRNIALAQPYGIFVAHNHLSGVCAPSEDDDLFTNKIQFICNMNDVNLWDHLIFADGKFFSYKYTGRLEEGYRKYSLDN